MCVLIERCIRSVVGGTGGAGGAVGGRREQRAQKGHLNVNRQRWRIYDVFWLFQPRLHNLTSNISSSVSPTWVLASVVTAAAS